MDFLSAVQRNKNYDCFLKHPSAIPVVSARCISNPPLFLTFVQITSPSKSHFHSQENTQTWKGWVQEGLGFHPSKWLFHLQELKIKKWGNCLGCGGVVGCSGGIKAVLFLGECFRHCLEKKRDPTPQRGRCPNTFPLLSMSVFNERILQRHMGWKQTLLFFLLHFPKIFLFLNKVQKVIH